MYILYFFGPATDSMMYLKEYGMISPFSSPYVNIHAGFHLS